MKSKGELEKLSNWYQTVKVTTFVNSNVFLALFEEFCGRGGRVGKEGVLNQTTVFAVVRFLVSFVILYTSCISRFLPINQQLHYYLEFLKIKVNLVYYVKKRMGRL